MKKDAKKKLLSIAIAFSIVELILGILVQTVGGAWNTVVSFAVVVLACAFAPLMLTRTNDYLFTQIALVCTVFADLFLVVITPQYRGLAMLFFSGTQICYFLRIFLGQENKKEKLVHLILRASLVVVALTATVAVLKENTDFVSLISLFYYANLIMNVIYAFVQRKKSLIFAIGLLLFALCDLFIGFSVLDDSYLKLTEGTILYWFAHPGFNLAWIFYVPSQALLPLSLLKIKLKTIE